jgi:putative transposase
MPRTARLEYPGACYHVINRGNYRKDIFESEGARGAFERTLFEACERSGWRLHAFVILRNHFHLALETPEANLSEGMKWLQGTWVSRFNRLRKVQGRPFQGRFKSILVQPGPALAEVSHYIHLNPSRAKVVSMEDLPKFRWSSLHYFGSKRRPPFLDGSTVLEAAGALPDTPKGWRAYHDYLAFRVSDDPAARARKFKKLSRGWSIGDEDFRAQLRRRLRDEGTPAKRFEGMTSAEWAAERSHQWELALQTMAREAKVDLASLGRKTTVPEKMILAYLLKKTTDASNGWIAERLGMGQPATVSQNVRRFKLNGGDTAPRVQAILSRIKQCPL